mgnify:CR=1 FL=1
MFEGLGRGAALLEPNAVLRLTFCALRVASRA